MNRRILVIGTGVFALAAFTGGVVLFDRFRRPTETGSVSSNLVRPHSPTFGPHDAPVTIVEFFDPSCEACRAMYPVVKQILAAFPGKVRLVMRYAPFHEGSDEVVKMLEAARLQGRFEAVLEVLLDRQAEWAVHGAPNLDRAWQLARQAGLEVGRARRDMSADAITRVLEQDIADLRANNVQKTPTFLVNGKPLPSFGAQQLHDLVRSEVQRTAPSGAS